MYPKYLRIVRSVQDVDRIDIGNAEIHLMTAIKLAPEGSGHSQLERR